MNFSFHNRLKIYTPKKEYVFYNNVLGSLLERLSSFQKYNEYISIGNGLPNEESQNNFHLTNHILTSKLTNQSFQCDISNGNLFAKYEFQVSKKQLDAKFITEIALSDNNSKPIIFNYFSLISDETPNGIVTEDFEELLFEVTVNLLINEEDSFLLTSGQNPFIEYLLGNGLDEVYICSGSNYSENHRINRQVNPNSTQFICNKSVILQDNSLDITFEQSLNIGEIDEILFITKNQVFARKNIKEINSTSDENSTFTAKQNYIIKIDNDIKSINSITNQSLQTIESNYFVSKYANSFGDKITLPFDNIFNSTTSRFLSKCGKLLFFVLNDKVYGYVNRDFNIEKIDTSEICESYITKIISFENYVFVISKIFPFVSSYIISDMKLLKINNNFSEFENINDLENYFQIDITNCNNNKFILGLIKKDKTAMSIYFDHSEENGFLVSGEISNGKNFNYLLAMYKNNFCDGQVIYLKEGTSSAECRIVTHSANFTETDIYSSLAYYLTKDSTNIYCKGRAIISEKTTNPSVMIYYYPQIFEYELPLISNEIKDYISTDLNYIIQQFENNEFKIYNLVGYDTPEKFSNNISDIADTSKILDFEFMKDSLIIFLNSEEPIIAYNLKLNKTQIENLSNNNTDYLVNFTKYNKLGKDNETVNFKFLTRINL